jgi:ABC-2 type transport system permease protein
MDDLRLAAVQARYALLTSFRTPRVVVFALAFPIVLLVLFNSIFSAGGPDTIHFDGRTISAEAYFTAGMAAYAIGLSTFTNLAVGITAQRESGQLKRLRGTPMPTWTFVAAQVMRAGVLVAMMCVALVAIGVLAYGVDPSAERLVGFVVYAALGTLAFCALGIAITSYTPTVDSASTVGPFAMVLLSFVSGVFVSVDNLPGWLEHVGSVFPLYHLANGLQTCLAPGGGTGLAWNHVAVLALWGMAGVYSAMQRFRWEPQAGRGETR